MKILVELILILLFSASAGPTVAGAQESSDQSAGSADQIPNTQKLETPMTPPVEALKMMQLPDGFQSTLFAAEPDIHQPISVTTDARGRLWLVECYTCLLYTSPSPRDS